MGTKALACGLAVAAIACGSAAAAMPAFSLRVHARLAPVAGTTAVGRFDGGLVMTGPGAKLPLARTIVPRFGRLWRLGWKLSLPQLSGPMTASLRIGATDGAPRVTRLLCKPCSGTENGVLALTGSQALRIAGSHAVVVVRAPSVRLRGAVEAVFAVAGKS